MTTSTPLATTILQRINDRTARICIIGQGYVGLPAAMRSAEVGFPTTGYEVDKQRVDSLRSGESYIGDVPDDRLRAALATKYHPTDELGDLVGFDVAVITVPTPLRDGAPDLSYVEAAAAQLARVLTAGAVVVLESTTYPGTTRELLIPILEAESGLRAGHDFFVGYSPERIDPGNATWTFENTPKVVGGLDADSLQLVEAFYLSLVDQVVPVSCLEEAELVKILENTFRHVNIALVNELAMFARGLDVDVWRAVDAAATKPFGFMPFRPGPGVGGHCLPIDPSYLSWRVRQHLGQSFRFVELANDVNEHMPDHVVARIQELLNDRSRSVRGTDIVLLGLTYKANTSDFRESPSLRVAERLESLGANLVGCDPHVPDGFESSLGMTLAPFDAETLAAAELVVVLVDHPEFDPAFIAEHAKVVFDTKGLLRSVDFEGELL